MWALKLVVYLLAHQFDTALPFKFLKTWYNGLMRLMTMPLPLYVLCQYDDPYDPTLFMLPFHLK